MNDLTKEELLEIVEYCEAWAPPGLGMSDFRVKLWIKLQSMIDKYCEQTFNPDCYCGQVTYDKTIITGCGYPPHKKIT